MLLCLQLVYDVSGKNQKYIFYFVHACSNALRCICIFAKIFNLSHIINISHVTRTALGRKYDLICDLSFKTSHFSSLRGFAIGESKSRQ